jgi:hypothetical protein
MVTYSCLYVQQQNAAPSDLYGGSMTSVPMSSCKPDLDSAETHYKYNVLMMNSPTAGEHHFLVGATAVRAPSSHIIHHVVRLLEKHM